MLQGQGSFDFPDGAHYEGEFDQGQMHGQGTFNWPGGEQYVGEFRNGKRQGQIPGIQRIEFLLTFFFTIFSGI